MLRKFIIFLIIYWLVGKFLKSYNEKDFEKLSKDVKKSLGKKKRDEGQIFT